MPERSNISPAHIRPRERLSGIEVLRLAVLVLVCLAVAVLFFDVRKLDSGLLKNRETGYQSRAVSCEVLQALGKPLPSPCLDPKVQKYMRQR